MQFPLQKGIFPDLRSRSRPEVVQGHTRAILNAADGLVDVVAVVFVGNAEVFDQHGQWDERMRDRWFRSRCVRMKYVEETFD